MKRIPIKPDEDNAVESPVDAGDSAKEGLHILASIIAELVIRQARENGWITENSEGQGLNTKELAQGDI